MKATSKQPCIGTGCDWTTATTEPTRRKRRCRSAARSSYRITFPDPGLYWYHPHIREDYGQEMGLYGNILVMPAEEGYWPPVDRELVLTLDDILIDDGGVAPFGRTETTYAAMGRYGNVILVAGQQISR